MAQITTGLRKILSISSIYDALQNGLGARTVRNELCREYIRAKAGETILDVGCGTALILDHLPAGVVYHGFDLSERYIAAARKRYKDRGTFSCADITTMPVDSMPPCDIAVAIGILHHLDDDGAHSLLSNLHQRMAANGRLVTIDPAYWPNQSRIARAVIARDRGQNVRTGEAYRALASESFATIKVIRRDDLLRIPYTHAILLGIK